MHLSHFTHILECWSCISRVNRPRVTDTGVAQFSELEILRGIINAAVDSLVQSGVIVDDQEVNRSIPAHQAVTISMKRMVVSICPFHFLCSDQIHSPSYLHLILMEHHVWDGIMNWKPAS
jgi:hypothetical protein